MSNKKRELTDEELDNVSGGSCSSPSEGSQKQCISCESTNLYWSDCGYNIVYFSCNDCGKQWNESNNGIEELN